MCRLLLEASGKALAALGEARPLVRSVSSEALLSYTSPLKCWVLIHGMAQHRPNSFMHDLSLLHCVR